MTKNATQGGQSGPNSTLMRQAAKVKGYLIGGDFAGLQREIQQYMRWRKRRQQIGAAPIAPGQLDTVAATAVGHGAAQQKSESEYWDDADIDLIRHASWLSAGGGALGQWALDTLCADHQGDVAGTMLTHLGGKPLTGLRGLVLGCGDMVAEYRMFVDPRLQFAHIDAHDISPASVGRARQVTDEQGLSVKYFVSDINRLELPAETYDLVICFYAYHHFTEVDAIAHQINRTLRPNGLFFTIDYVGERQQQFSDDQMFFANQFLKLLPPRYRRELDGRERQQAQRIPVEFFSPDEAIRSDDILAAIDQNMRVVRQYNWAGLLMPLLEGLGFNVSTSASDIDMLRFLFEVDQALVKSGRIGPNFTMTMAGKKSV